MRNEKEIRKEMIRFREKARSFPHLPSGMTLGGVYGSTAETLAWVLEEETNKTIQVEVSEGCVQDVKGLPDGYQYEIVECDKYGEPLPKEEDGT